MNERPTIPCTSDPMAELLEQVEAVSLRQPKAWACAMVANEVAGGTDAFGLLALTLFEATEAA